MADHFFITGGTGLFGKNLIPRILKAYPGSTIRLLVRGKDEEQVQQRIAALCRQIELDNQISSVSERVDGVRGDVSRDALGLDRGQLSDIVSRTTHLIHGAALLRFDLSLQQAREINLAGTERALSIAKQGVDGGRLRRFVYIGTSSVSGRRSDRVYEHELEMGQAFFNTYEQSKYESEMLVRSYRDRFHTTVFRPSIVIGESKSGKTTLFNVIYLPLRLLHKGMIRYVPAPPETLLDLVPIDWAAEAMVTILKREDSTGGTFHIAAGPDRAAKLGDVAAHAVAYFDKHSPLREPRAAECITHEEFERRVAGLQGTEALVMKQMDRLFDYLTLDRLFDTMNTDAFLEGSGIHFPLYETYADNILGYCIASNWGKKTLANG
jgi:thioester reductase-like protein